MSSAFSRRAAVVGTPLAIRHNGETVTLYGDDDSETKVSAIVDLDDATSAGEGFVEIEGRLSVRTADFSGKINPNGVVRSALIRGHVYYTFSQSTDQNGLTTFNIRRKFDEQQQSNLYDLHGNQIPYAAE
jgi:hypothetical protein